MTVIQSDVQLEGIVSGEDLLSAFRDAVKAIFPGVVYERRPVQLTGEAREYEAGAIITHVEQRWSFDRYFHQRVALHVGRRADFWLTTWSEINPAEEYDVVSVKGCEYDNGGEPLFFRIPAERKNVVLRNTVELVKGKVEEQLKRKGIY